MTHVDDRDDSAQSKKDERILIAWIGEYVKNPIIYFREMMSVDGNRYLIHHRLGRMYCSSFDTDEIMFDRDEGGPYDSCGSDEQILEQTSDFFRKVARGEPCCICGAIYPPEIVPHVCFNCGSLMRWSRVVSLSPLKSGKLSIPLRARESQLEIDRKLGRLGAGEISNSLEKGPIKGGWILIDEFGTEFWAVVTENLVAGIRIRQNESSERFAQVLKGYTLTGEETGTFVEYMLDLLVLEDGEMQLDLDLLKCPKCNAFKQYPDAPCPAECEA